MLKRDPRGKFTSKTVGIFRTRQQWRFETGNMWWGWMEETDYNSILARQEQYPVPLGKDSSSKRIWWMFKGEFYWEDDGYSASQVAALILDRIAQKEKKVDRAIARLSQATSTSVRQPIPDDVKILVWQRDGGRCVKCGSQKNLEYDHIIPLSKGGGNTARNLQLLCEDCNRAKGGNLY